MMNYVTRQDFINRRIQEVILNQITQNKDVVRQGAVEEAIGDIRSYLQFKYDLSDEMKEVKTLSDHPFYYNTLIFCDALDYIATSTYNVNDFCSNNNLVYRCTATTTGVFDVTKWRLVGERYSYFSIVLPYPRYKDNENYYLDDYVLYNSKIYRCIHDSKNNTPDELNSSYWVKVTDFIFDNIYPWSTLADFTEYAAATFATGSVTKYQDSIYYCFSQTTEPPTNGDYWVKIQWQNKDNRYAKLVGCCIDLALYYIYKRSQHTNIPELVVSDYDQQIKWLRSVGGQGEAVIADLPKIQPKQGRRLIVLSNTKNQNRY